MYSRLLHLEGLRHIREFSVKCNHLQKVEGQKQESLLETTAFITPGLLVEKHCR
jgi:hypothetical protein